MVCIDFPRLNQGQLQQVRLVCRILPSDPAQCARYSFALQFFVSENIVAVHRNQHIESAAGFQLPDPTYQKPRKLRDYHQAS